MADIAKELRKIAKPTKVLAGLGPNGAVYRTDRHPNEKLLKRHADAVNAEWFEPGDTIFVFSGPLARPAPIAQKEQAE